MPTHTLKIAADLSLPIDAVTNTFAILAKRGVGKTYTGAVMVEEMLAAGQQVVVCDPIGVWWGLRSSADGKSPGFPIVVFGGEHADVPLEENSGEIIAGAIIENGFSAILDLSLLRKNAQVRFMTAFAETLYRLNRKPLHLAVDEADAFAPQRPMKGEERLLGAFEDIVRRGRARGLGVTLITQRAAVLNKNVLTQIEVLIVLRTISPQDREAIETWTEIHGTKKQLEQLSESMASLPIGSAWFWSPGWLDIFKRVQVRKRITFDSSSTPKIGEKVVAPKEVAAVDLNKLGEQIKSTAEKAKENDPVELKRMISTLRREITTLKQAKPATETKIKREVAMTDAERRRLTTLIESHERVEAVGNKIESMATEIKTTMVGSRSELAFFKTLLSGKLSPQPVARPLAHPAAPNVRVPVVTRTAASPNGTLPHGEEKILSACIQFLPEGLKREQITVLTTFKRSTRDAYIYRLATKGLVDASTDVIFATPEGVAALPNHEPLPTGEELQEHWRQRLPSGERQLFEHIIAAYPNSVSRDQLSELTGFKRSTRDAYLYRMSNKMLFSDIGRGEVRASDNLFS